MSTKYHVGRDGMPKVCKAHSGNCPMGEETEHFTDKMDALEYATQKLEEEYGSVASHRRKTDYHIGESGAIEICDEPESCSVRPYKKFKNVHSTDQNVVIGAGQAFREAIGAINATSGSGKNTRSVPRPDVAVDPITDEARRLRGAIKSSGTYKPKPGDIIRVKYSKYSSPTDFPGGRPRNVIVEKDTDTDEELKKFIDQGVPPEDIEVMTADSCHHSVQSPDLSNIVSHDSPSDFRTNSSSSDPFPVVNVGPTLKPYPGARKVENGEVYAGEEVSGCWTGPTSLQWTRVTDDEKKNPPRHVVKSEAYVSVYDENDNPVHRVIVYNAAEAKTQIQEMIDSGVANSSEDIYVEPRLPPGSAYVYGDRTDPDFSGVDLGSGRNTDRPYRPRIGDVIVTRRAGSSSQRGIMVYGKEDADKTLRRVQESGWSKDEITILTKDSGYTEMRFPELPAFTPRTPRTRQVLPPASYSTNSWSHGGARC